MSLLAPGSDGVKSVSNSTTTALAGGATFTGVAETNDFPDILVAVKSDVAGTLYVDFSTDGGSNYDSTLSRTVIAGVNKVHRFVKGARTVRVRFINGSSSQSYLRLYTSFGTFGPLTAGLNGQIEQDVDTIVTRSTSEDEVMQSRVRGEHIFTKYGRNPDVDAAEDIWNVGGDYTGFPTTTAEEFQVLSSDAADAAAGTGARTVRVYYLDANYNIEDADGNFLYFDVTLNGTTAVNSGVTGMRIYRVKVLTSGSGQTNAGTITVRWRTTTAAIFCVVPIGFGHTQISNFTIPAGYTGYMKRYDATMDDQTSNAANMAIKVRDFGSNTFRLIRPFAVSTTKDVSRTLYGGEKFEEKTDLVFRATSVTNTNAIITVSYGLRLSKS